MNQKQTITIEATIHADIEKVWSCWSKPEHIKHWNSASNDWHTPYAENDFRVGGKFNYRMEAKDGSFGFDFWGTYDEVLPYKTVAYTLGDDRRVINTFTTEGKETKVKVAFEAESENSLELQQEGWQSILDHFKRYVEGLPSN